MATRTIQSSARSKSQQWRERAGVFALAGGIISVIAVYLAVNATGGRNDSRGLLPYQTLVRTLPEPDQRLFRAIREGLLAAESERARTKAWPEPASLAAQGVAPFAPPADGAEYQWSRSEQSGIVNYSGRPRDPSQPAWLLEIQEPEPGMRPDPAPLDDQHHRLPDGTTLHIYVWMHRFGGQVPVGFVRQPQTSGWIEVFSTPPNLAFYNRR
jgi:hypothetical protein